MRTLPASGSGREEPAALSPLETGGREGRGGGAGRRVKLKGVFSVLPTPFVGGGDIDLGSLDRVVELYVGAGVDGVTVLGVTGEVTRLTERERGLVAERVIERVAGRVAVIVGTTADGLRTCIEYSRVAKAAGATAVMVSPPRMPRVNSDAVVRHYAALADAVDLPIVVQDYPPVSGFFMEPVLLARIAREVPSARTIKLEDPPTPFKTSRILEQAGDVPVDVLGGLGGVFLLEELMAGAAGVMTGFAYPEVLVEVVRRFQAGDRDAAADVFYAHVPLMRFEFQEGIGMAIRKEVLRRRGALADASTRAPAPALDAPTRAALERVLAWTAGRGGSRWISA
jgi:4-hydroxy-tetrahydrodipicolinate synthase